MIILQVNELSKSFGAESILSNVKLEVQSRERVALVGRNGAGKSTLLKIITGEMSYDSGNLIIPKDVSLGYLAQDTGLESSLSIWDEMLTVFSSLRKMEKELRQLEHQMGNPDLMANEPEYEKVLQTYDQLQVTYGNEGGYQYENDIRSVLHGLQFDSMDYSTSVSTLSGGQKTRLALGKLLLVKPELLILDEPTNHLDIDTLTWLEQYLQSYPGAILIVSHDRYFLDKIIGKVYEISRHKTTKFLGNYSRYMEQKAERFEQELKEYERQQEEIANLKDFVQRNIARASTTKRAQSRRRQLEKMTVIDRPQGDEKSASFSFAIDKNSGNDVLKLDHVSTGYEGQALIKAVNLHVQRQESIALVGPNGIGKSTLLKSIIKKIPTLEGSIQLGSNVTIGYYDQEQASLSSNKTVLQELWDEYPLHPEKELRTVLGNFLFSGDDVLKIVNELSGGQKARLALSKLMMQGANLLIMDEPTNHLDLDSKEVLENALIDFPGTILFVSHDRYFINRIATRVIELSTDGLTNYLGDYSYYVDKKAELEALEAFDTKDSREKSAPEIASERDKPQFELDKQAKRDHRKRVRRIEEIESEIEELESKLEENEDMLCSPDVFNDHEKSFQLNEENEQIHEKLERLLEEWESLQSN
jgi:ATP-binding cassette subfamily F protein 3